MNSFIQALFHMQDYREAIIAIDEALLLVSEEKQPTLHQKVKSGVY